MGDLSPFLPQIHLISSRIGLGSSDAFPPPLRARPPARAKPTFPTFLETIAQARGGMDAAKSVTPGAVSHILANPSPGDAAEIPELVVQVVDLKSIGTGSRFR